MNQSLACKRWLLETTHQNRGLCSLAFQLPFGLRIADQTFKMTGLCQVCNSQDVRDLLKDAVEGIKLPDLEKNSVHLGRWVDLQSRRESCRLCDAVISLLQETITIRLPSKYPVFQKTIKEDEVTLVDCSATHLRLITLQTRLCSHCHFRGSPTKDLYRP